MTGIIASIRSTLKSGFGKHGSNILLAAGAATFLSYTFGLYLYLLEGIGVMYCGVPLALLNALALHSTYVIQFTVWMFFFAICLFFIPGRRARPPG